MDETTYKFLMGASAFVIAILGLMLAGTTILPEVGLEKLRKARSILIPSYFVLALLSLVCCLTGYDRRIEPASTLLVASFQALLFTMSMLVFIRPNEVRWKTVFRQAGVITVAGLVLFVSFFRFTDYYSCFFYSGVVAYVLQLIIYTRKFMLAYRKTVQEVEDYYDDDEENRLVWVKCGFFSALAVGIMALSILFFPVLYKYFVPLYVVFYSFMVMWFVNYYRRMKFAIPVIAAMPQEADVCAIPETVLAKTDGVAAEEAVAVAEEAVAVKEEKSGAEHLLKERLQKYIDEKEYCRKDVPSGIVADSFGMSKAFFRQYMKDSYGMDFRPWRKELRLREASRLFAGHPEYTIEEVSEMVGYNNSSNFNRDFKRMMGMTPKCFCKQFQ
ncbi:helix-turn-helix transcriptional regulator [uncultured Bacteroides sp.]|uniref:helix-turn-helix transcriptional regulator n=1 Tax=uncultured Bacteroides sp. TaxID=162156 RepID=UPI0025F3D694|nr:helix-turn-helix transcriptional regulator [uncultured Bacteroides sp.]